MSLKEFYQKNSSIIHWGILGFIVGFIPILIGHTGLFMFAIVLWLPAMAVYSIMHLIFLGSFISFEGMGVGLIIFALFLYTAIGLLIGWIFNRIGKYFFRREQKIETNIIN